MNPPICCPQCDKEILGKGEISSIQDLLKQCGILLKQGDAERAREALESLQYVCLFPLYGEGCATVPRASQSEDDGLMTDLDKLFEGLLARSGRDTGLERLQLLAYDKPRVFEPPKSHNRTDNIPPWGLDSLSVLAFLTYLDPYSDDQRTRKRLQCVYDAISERWWRRSVPADSPLREMDAADVEKLMFAIREKGNEVLYFEPPPAGPCWLLKCDASDKIDHRFQKHVNLNLSDKTRRQAIGYLVAPMPASRLLEEGPFIKIVKMVLSLWNSKSASENNLFTDDVIRKAIRLIGLQNLKKISQIPKNAIREYCFTNPSSLAIDPGKVACFLGNPPDMHLTRDDTEIRALLDGFDPEALAALWLQANSYIRNQIIDAFEKSDLRCAQRHCNRRLPNKEERRWIDLTREWLGQYGLEELYVREKPFCLCPEKDLGNSGDERAQWRRKRAKLVAAVVLKYHKLDEDPTHARNARFLLKTMADLMNGKRLSDETDGTLKTRLRRFIKFGNEWLYEKKLEVPGRGEICVADMIDTELFSSMLLLSTSYKTALDELRMMADLLGCYFNSSYAGTFYNSENPIPRKEYDPDEAVWRRMADDDFIGDPWAREYTEKDYLDDIDYEIDSYDPDEDRAALACSELRVLVKSGHAEPQTMQELETMSYDELKAKVHENLKARLKAIGNRIGFLCSSPPSDSQ